MYNIMTTPTDTTWFTLEIQEYANARLAYFNYEITHYEYMHAKLLFRNALINYDARFPFVQNDQSLDLYFVKHYLKPKQELAP